MEDEDDRLAREAKEQEEKYFHKMTKLAKSLRIDVNDLIELEKKSKAARKDLGLGGNSKEIVWRRRGLLKRSVAAPLWNRPYPHFSTIRLAVTSKKLWTR